jgi:two-component system, OmpR family, response regulator
MAEKRILLVEDDEDVGELLAIALEDAGYEVDVAKTAAESWARLAAQGYALVIADWRLPDGDGSVIADGAADLGARTFIMSGYLPELPSDRREGHRCLTKPIHLDAFIATVQEAIGAPTAQR